MYAAACLLFCVCAFNAPQIPRITLPNAVGGVFFYPLSCNTGLFARIFSLAVLCVFISDKGPDCSSAGPRRTDRLRASTVRGRAQNGSHDRIFAVLPAALSLTHRLSRRNGLLHTNFGAIQRLCCLAESLTRPASDCSMRDKVGKVPFGSHNTFSYHDAKPLGTLSTFSSVFPPLFSPTMLFTQAALGDLIRRAFITKSPNTRHITLYGCRGSSTRYYQQHNKNI